jgi:Matrixin
VPRPDPAPKLAAAVFVSAFSWAATAGAFCRTTTCDAAGDQSGCKTQNGCSEDGLPLYWPEQCLSFGVQKDGSPRRHISWETADSIIRVAFQQWFGATCDGGTHPSFKMFDLDEAGGPIVCARPEFNRSAPNANVWMFRDDKWPYTGQNSTLALTTITFEVPTGKILDADVEINSYKIDLTTDGTGSDLQSIVTHEAGHFLGLAHSTVATATMNAAYQPGDMSFRSLDPDDIKGICAIYPADRDSPACSQPTPRHGFSRYCGDEPPDDPQKKGCATSRAAPADVGPAFAAVAVAVGAMNLRRKRRARVR